MQKIKVEQGSQEWLDLRKNYIGASDAPIIMGDSPWTTPYQLWLQKTGLAKPKPKTSSMERGISLEPIARQKFIDNFGIEVLPAVCKHDDIPWLLASFDGLSADEKTVVEIKCPNHEDHFLAAKKMVPAKYQAQLQHQLYIAGVEKMYYASFYGNELACFLVERNDKYIDNLLIKEAEFWERVKSFNPPEGTKFDLVISYRKDKIWEEKVEEWKQCRKASEKEEEIRKELIEMCDGDITEGCGVRISRRIEKGRIKYSDIPEIQGINLDSYRGSPVVKHVIGTI